MSPLLHRLLERSAAHRPEREAVRCAGRGLTYGELDALADRIAYMLFSFGVRRGDRVGLYLRKSPETIAAVYGVLKAGAAYVPLDSLAPPGRLAHVLSDCDVRCLISGEEMRPSLEQLTRGAHGVAAVIGLAAGPGIPVRAAGWDEVRAAPSKAPQPAGQSELDPAYILYTSGSTGPPKGIVHTHRSASSFVEWATGAFGLSSDDRLANHAPLHFDLSIFDLFAGAAAGAVTVLVPERVTRLPAEVSTLIEREALTIWYSVPFALTQLLARGALERRDLSSLRRVLFAGEAFPVRQLRRLMELLPAARFSNLYGPTETNVCTFYNVPPLPEGPPDPLPIGRACAGAELSVVDSADRVVTAGEPGELLVRGPLRMRGYWNRPDLDARALASRPEGEGFYRTGDLVRELPGGDLDFLGRRDRQIKVRGHRVELEEIEATLRSHPLVEESTAYAVAGGDGGGWIEAAVVAQAGAALEPPDLAKHAAAHLPACAVPDHILVLPELPRTSTGKIDQRALVARSMERENGHKDRVAESDRS